MKTEYSCAGLIFPKLNGPILWAVDLNHFSDNQCMRAAHFLSAFIEKSHQTVKLVFVENEEDIINFSHDENLDFQHQRRKNLLKLKELLLYCPRSIDTVRT
jgi:hypothetical protein